MDESCVSTWSVPSTQEPGTYYTVKYFHANGGTSCTCSWGKKADAPTKCWHARFVTVLENREVQAWVGWIVRQQAERGRVEAQVQMLQFCAGELVKLGRIRAAAQCFQVLEKYMSAISVQGAHIPEAAAVAASAA